MLDMGMIKIEVNLSEVTRAVEEFRSNKLKALEALTKEVKGAVSRFFNQLLHAEMSLFLGRPDQENNKRNGYYERSYALKGIGSLQIRMPTDRKHEFRSEILPSHERMDPRLKNDLALLHLAGISTRMVGMISRKLLGVEVSTDTVSKSLEPIEEKALTWLIRPITGKYWALFVDGTNFRMQRRGSTEKEPSLVVLGLDEQWKMSILAIEPGQKDNAPCWRSLFGELKNRGLNGLEVRLGIMDGLAGLESVFREEFPKAQTARCWVHAMKNAMSKVPERLSDSFKSLAHKVMYAANEDDARKQFHSLKAAFGTDAQRAVSCLEKDLDSLLVHYRFDSKLWRTLKTTNPIERVNRELKRRIKTMETLGERTLRIVTAFVALRLEFHWQKVGVDSIQIKNLKPFQLKEFNQIESVMGTMIQ
jgi:putative transposase